MHSRWNVALLLTALLCNACSRKDRISPDTSPPAVSQVAVDESAHPAASTLAHEPPTSASAAPVPQQTKHTGRAVVLAGGQKGPGDLALDGTSVYWANYHGDTVMKVPIRGGAAIVLASGQASPHAIAVDASFVYWATLDSIMKVPVDGGTATLVVHDRRPVALALDGTNLYWVTASELKTVPLAGGAPIALASGLGGATTIAVRGQRLFWLEDEPNRVMTLPIGGTSPVTLASGGRGFVRLAVDDSDVYWTDMYAGSLSKVPATGGPAKVLASGPDGALGVAVDQAYAYFTCQRGIMKVSKAGGTPILVAESRWSRAVAVDAANIYWANAGSPGERYADGSIMKSPR